MSLANGRTYLAIPGPSVMPDRVLQAMQQPAPNIYEGALSDMTFGLVPDLKKIAGTDHDVAIYITNGHGLWEAALSNTLSRGDKVLAAASGMFCHGWVEMAQTLGLDVEVMDFGDKDPIDADRVADRLRADSDHDIKAVICVQVDTSTSVLNDIQTLGAALRGTGHPALFMVDCIASLGCERFEMDAWHVDVMIAASQKGLMTPPGLGCIWFNDQAAKARQSADLATRYWDWTPRANPTALWEFFDGTAPTHLLFALREAVSMMMEESLPAIFARHETLARAIWAAVECWASQGALRLNIADPAQRSHAVTTLHVPDGNATRLRQWVEANAGVTLGIGLGFSPADDTFRIGHMGHVNAHMVLGVLGAIQAALVALEIPHGSGALEAAAHIIARG